MYIYEEAIAAHSAMQQSTLGLCIAYALMSLLMQRVQSSMFYSFTLLAINPSNPQDYSSTCRLR